MANYTVEKRMLYDGKLYGPAAARRRRIALDDDAAAGPLAAGAIAPMPAPGSISTMTVAALLDMLTGLHVNVPPGAKKDDLVALYRETVAAGEEDKKAAADDA